MQKKKKQSSLLLQNAAGLVDMARALILEISDLSSDVSICNVVQADGRELVVAVVIVLIVKVEVAF